jgi:hypothetical protein
MHADEFSRLSTIELRELLDKWREKQQREDYRAAKICVLLAEVNRDQKKKPIPFEVWDFFTSLEPLKPAPPSPQELAAKVASWASLVNGG